MTPSTDDDEKRRRRNKLQLVTRREREQQQNVVCTARGLPEREERGVIGEKHAGVGSGKSTWMDKNDRRREIPEKFPLESSSPYGE